MMICVFYLNELIKDLLPDIAWTFVTFYVAKELYKKWGLSFLDNQKNEVIVSMPQHFTKLADDNKDSLLQVVAPSAQNIMYSVRYNSYNWKQWIPHFSYVELTQRGPLALWNAYTIHHYFHLSIMPSSLDKCRLDCSFCNLPIDVEFCVKA